MADSHMWKWQKYQKYGQKTEETEWEQKQGLTTSEGTKDTDNKNFMRT